MYKLSEDISKSAFFMNLQRKSDFPTYHVIEAKKRCVRSTARHAIHLQVDINKMKYGVEKFNAM
jgi:hypothetical protein